MAFSHPLAAGVAQAIKLLYSIAVSPFAGAFIQSSYPLPESGREPHNYAFNLFRPIGKALPEDH